MPCLTTPNHTKPDQAPPYPAVARILPKFHAGAALKRSVQADPHRRARNVHKENLAWRIFAHIPRLAQARCDVMVVRAAVALRVRTRCLLYAATERRRKSVFNHDSSCAFTVTHVASASVPAMRH